MAFSEITGAANNGITRLLAKTLLKGTPTRTAEQLAPGDIIRTRFADGEVESVVAKQKL